MRSSASIATAVSWALGRKSARSDCMLARLACTDTLSAATTVPEASLIGTAAERSPSSSSWSVTAKPCRRTLSSVVRSASRFFTVRLRQRLDVERGPAAPSSSSVDRLASSTRPIEVAYAGSLVPTASVMLMMRRVGTRTT